MSMEMLKIYRFIISEQHAYVDGNVNVMEHANINENVKNTSIYRFRSGLHVESVRIDSSKW